MFELISFNELVLSGSCLGELPCAEVSRWRAGPYLHWVDGCGASHQPCPLVPPLIDVTGQIAKVAPQVTHVGATAALDFLL